MKRNNGLRMLAALVVAVTFAAMTASASAESLKAFATRRQ
jgi:hypothetical protein